MESMIENGLGREAVSMDDRVVWIGTGEAMHATRHMRYGDWLRTRRLAAGMTQRELGLKTGIDPSYLSKIERSYYESLPEPDRLAEICRALGTTPEDALTSIGYIGRTEESTAEQTFATMLQEVESLAIPDRLRRSLKESIQYVRDQTLKYRVEE